MIPRFRVASLVALLLLLMLGLSVVPGAVTPAAADLLPDKVEPDLWQVIQQEGQAGFFAILREQADTSGAVGLSRKVDKGRFVFDALRATADRTQAELRAYLSARGAVFQPYYIANAIYIEGDRDLLLEVAARPEVAQLTLNRQFQAINPRIADEPFGPPSVNTVEWNISFIGADMVWDQYGVMGQGAVIGDLDTGVDWDHPALIDQYRGWNGSTADHNYNWWDATTSGAVTVPYDDHGHGTHTTGTIVGYAAAQDLHIGVAPGAKWIGCKNMNSAGSGFDAWFLTCFEFSLAPWDSTGQNPDPALAPDALNNSWGYFGGGNPVFYTAVQNLRDAGVVVEVSAGNEGPSCATLRSPGDYDNTFVTGATANRSETLVSFSSRGPSDLNSNIKPDIVAPGEGINSSLPGGGYSGETWSGTSMAGPHVVGAVALVVSANPALEGQVDFIEDLLRNTAYQGMPDPPNPDSCGGIAYNVVPNHIYGWGRLDVMAAVTQIVASGHIQGHVYDKTTGNVLADALIDFGNGQTTSTDATGYYTATVPADTYTVTASKYGWLALAVPDVVVVEDQTTTQDFTLERAPRYRVGGRTLDAATGLPIGAHLELQLGGVPVAGTDSDPDTGRFLMRVFEGTYTLVTTAEGYNSDTQSLTVDSNVRLSISLQPPWKVGANSTFQYWRFDGEYFDSGNGQTYDQKVYFLGGRMANDATDGTVWRFDPLAGTYAMTGATLPVPISNYTVNLVQDSTGLGLYVFGGRDSAGGMRTEVQVYYPATNTSAIIATDPLPGPGRIPGNSVVVDNKVYLFGGWDGVQMYATTYVFDPLAPAGSRWTQLPNLNLARGYIMGAAVDGRVYAIGGDTWDGANLIAQTTVEALNTANTGAGWNDVGVADLPMGCDEAQAFGFDSSATHAYAGMILTAGCGNWPGESVDSFAYDPTANTWDASFSDLNQARRNHAGVYIPVGAQAGLWVFNGRQGADTTILNSTEYYPIATP